jgi:hypothetical protein
MNAVRSAFSRTKPGVTAPVLTAKSDDASLPAPELLYLLLSRISFGVNALQWEQARFAGYDAWLDGQLYHESIDNSGLETQLASVLPTLAMSNGQILQLVRDGGSQGQAATELTAATIARQTFSQSQLFEVMVQFWSNHFAMFIGDGAVRYYKTVDDREVIRKHALGNFGDLLKATARSPAMLYSLDNYLNVATGPNENYARELLELHTMGVNGGYTEDDVKAVARAFTGWAFTGYNPANGQNDVVFAFIRGRHDTAPKRVLGIDMPRGRGIEDGEQVLDILIDHPATARFIAFKLVRHFVSDQPPEALVDAVAERYLETRGDIKSMLRTLFRSDEFKGSHDEKIKRGSDYVVSALRATGATTGTDWLRSITAQLTSLGQLPFQWPTPDGYPDVGAYWVNTSSMLNRWNYAMALAEGRLGAISIDINALSGNARSPAEIVDGLASRVLHRPLAPSDRAALIAFVANGGNGNAPVAANQRTMRVQECLGMLLSSTYFMYR